MRVPSVPGCTSVVLVPREVGMKYGSVEGALVLAFKKITKSIKRRFVSHSVQDFFRTFSLGSEPAIVILDHLQLEQWRNHLPRTIQCHSNLLTMLLFNFITHLLMSSFEFIIKFI